MVANDIEIELRGRLTNEQYLALLSTLQRDGIYKEHKHRLFLDYSTFLPDEGVAERKQDIRLRINNGMPEIMTKIGGWGGDEHRREISIVTEAGSFDRLVETYGILGYTKAIVAERHTEVFEYKGFEFALVTVPNHSHYFEIETMAHGEADIPRVKSEMRAVCSEQKLEIFDDTGFYGYIEELNREANSVFEFKDFEPNYFSKRYAI